MSAELHEITEAVNTLIEHMDTSLPEERVKKVLDAALAEERRGRERLKWTILSPIIIAIFVAGGAWLQSRANGDTLTEAKTTADYVRHCLQHKTAGMTPQQIQTECGDSTGGQAFFVTYLNCVLKQPIEKRNDAYLNGCVEKGVAAATPTTTTTR